MTLSPFADHSHTRNISLHLFLSLFISLSLMVFFPSTFYPHSKCPCIEIFWKLNWEVVMVKTSHNHCIDTMLKYIENEIWDERWTIWLTSKWWRLRRKFSILFFLTHIFCLWSSSDLHLFRDDNPGRKIARLKPREEVFNMTRYWFTRCCMSHFIFRTSFIIWRENGVVE